MKGFLSVVLMLGGLLILEGCLADKGELTEEVSQDYCDSLQATYDDTVKTLIDLNCAVAGCHVSGFQNGDFSSYSSMSAFGVLTTDAGGIQARAIDENPSSMPPGNPLPDSVKAIFQCWINDGFPQQ